MNRSISSVLKNQARASGLTQVEIARAAKVSLPTVKRWLSGVGLDLKHLETLLRILGLSLVELATLVSSTSSHEFEYSLEQEIGLAKDPSLLAYLGFLFKGMTPQKIERRFGITDARSVYLLRSLEKLGLIERHSGQKVRVCYQGQARWRINGPLAKSFKKRAVEDFLSQANLAAVRLGIHEMNLEDFKRLEIMLMDVQNFARAAEARARILPDQPVNIGVLIAAAPFRWAVLETVRGSSAH